MSPRIAALGALALAACHSPAAADCSAETCNGCCEAGGCVACPDAGGGCGPATCSGCCLGDVCVPLEGEDAGRCGAGGGACAACAANQFCDLDAGACHGSRIEHVVLIVQENHSFDAYFGRYCTALAGSSPTCSAGPACCEAAPGGSPLDLSDSENYGSDRDHSQVCELCEMGGASGAMGHYTDGSCPNDASPFVSYACSSPGNFAIGSQTLLSTYWGLAAQGALADRYFQPIAGSSSSNDMYFAVAHYEFTDNDYAPQAIGWNCDPALSPTPIQYGGPGHVTIADLLIAHGNTFGVYADGYGDALAAAPGCATPSSDPAVCPEAVLTQACRYDPSDVPFQYYGTLTDNPSYIHDLGQLALALDAGTLPDLAYVKYRTSQNEHPGWSTISRGETNVSGIVDAVLSSPRYAANTLVLLTWDEGGGFFDHISPPPSVEWSPDGGSPLPYGTRVPLLALGRFARPNFVSHVTMEHASIVRFLEFNFLGAEGALGARDARVNGLGSLLDPVAGGLAPPSCNDACDGRACGLTGCGRSCGTCGAGFGCAAGLCVTCGSGACAGACSSGAFCPVTGVCYPTVEAAAADCGPQCTTCP